MNKTVDYRLPKKSQKEKRQPIIVFAENLTSFIIPNLAINVASVVREFFKFWAIAQSKAGHFGEER